MIDILIALHARKMVHLDFKPGNIMLDGRGRWKMIDVDGESWKYIH